MRQQAIQRLLLLRLLGAAQGILQHLADVLAGHELHVPGGEQPLADVFLFAQLDDVLVAAVVAQQPHQRRDFMARAFEPLKEDAAAEHQHAGDAVLGVAAARGGDDALHLVVVHARGGAAAIDHVVERADARAEARLVALWMCRCAHDDDLGPCGGRA
jgi:hypothetical protein